MSGVLYVSISSYTQAILKEHSHFQRSEMPNTACLLSHVWTHCLMGHFLIKKAFLPIRSCLSVTRITRTKLLIAPFFQAAIFVTHFIFSIYPFNLYFAIEISSFQHFLQHHNFGSSASWSVSQLISSIKSLCTSL